MYSILPPPFFYYLYLIFTIIHNVCLFITLSVVYLCLLYLFLSKDLAKYNGDGL